MAKKNSLKINNVLTGKTREIALPGRAENTVSKQTKSEGGSNVQRKS